MNKFNSTPTKTKAVALFIALLCAFVYHTNAQNLVWNRTLSGTAADKVTDVATDEAGNVYAVGYSNKQIVLNGTTYGTASATNYFPYVVKYNTAGVVQWVHVPTTLTAPFDLRTQAVIVDTSGNVYYSGSCSTTAGNTINFGSGNATGLLCSGNTDGFLVKLNAAGVAQWTASFSGCNGAVVNSVAIAFQKLNNTLIYGVSTTTNSNVCSNNMYHYCYASGYNTIGTFTNTNQQESYFGTILPSNGARVATTPNYQLGINQYSREFIEDIAVDGSGNIYLGCSFICLSPNGYVTDIAHSGGTNSITGSTAYNGLIIKLNSAFAMQGSYRVIASYDSRLKAITASSTGAVAYICDMTQNGIYNSVKIGGLASNFVTAWENTVNATGTANVVEYLFSGKGIQYDNNGVVWATVGAHSTAGNHPWTYTPAFPAASLGNVSANPGLMLLKLTYTSGSSAAWSDYKYIRETANNSVSQGVTTTPGSMALKGNHLYLAGGFSNNLQPTPLPQMNATDYNAYLIKLGCEPAFTTQPSSGSICGAAVYTLASVVNDPTATFQWKKNGVNIPGATNDTLVLTNPTAANAGTYILEATNACGTTASQDAVLSTTLPVIANLSAWFKFNNNTADSSGNGNHATASNAITPAANRFGQTNTAYVFGANSSVSVPATLLGNAQGKSVSMWFKRTAAGIPQPLITYQVTTPGAWNPVAYIGNDNVLRGWFYQGGGAPWSSGIVVDTNWHHLAITTTTNNQTAYLDGVQVATMTGTLNVGTSNVLRIGAGHLGVIPGVASANTYYFYGAIDEVRFYNATITATDIQQLYTQDLAISQHPQAQTLCIGNTLTLSVVSSNATGYQWQKNGVNVAGATSATYTLNNAQPSDAGTYACVLSSSCTGTSTTSNAAVVTVAAGATITQQPQSASVCLGATASFSVTVTGGSATYQWQKNSVNIAGATSATYNIAMVAAGDAGTYVCVVTGGCGATNSSSATLSILATTAISNQPAATTVCPGATATFSVTASGAGTLTYQWKKNGTNLSNGGNISGATTASLSISNASAIDAANYSVVVTGACGSVTSNNATLTLGTTTAISTQPQSQMLCNGATLNLSVVAAGDNLTYQWKKNNVNIGGATNASYSTGVSINTAGSYTVAVSGTCGSATSNAAVITVNDTVTITQQPQGSTVCEGSALNISVTATGAGLSYQWKLNGVNIPSATAATYSTASALPAMSGLYTVVVTGTCGSKTSSAATVTVNATTAITTQPITQTACTGSGVTFTVVAAGANLTYQWKKNNVNIGGATSATYNIASAVVGDAGSYTVVVTGTCGAATSNTATLSIVSSASISQQPVAQTICAGSAFTLSVVGTGGNNTTYQWRKGGVNISGATSATYNIAIAQASDAGSYDVIISGSCGSVTSSAAVLTVNPVSTYNYSMSICNGGSYVFDGNTLTASGQYNMTLQNANGCDSMITLNLTVLAPIASNISGSFCPGGHYDFNGTLLTAAGVYTDTLSNGLGCDSVITITLTQSATTSISTQPVASTTVCSGENISLSATAVGDNLTYQWKKNNVDISGATSASFYIASSQVSDAGTYKVEVSGTCGTETSSDATLIVNATPAPVISQSGNTLSSSETGASYQWQLNGSDIAGATAQSHDATASGNYTVAVTSAEGCTGTSALFNFSFVGVEDVALSNLVLYPNPTAGNIAFSNLPAGVCVVEVYSSIGELMMSETLNNSQVNLSPLASGLYQIVVKSNSGNALFKVMKD